MIGLYIYGACAGAMGIGFLLGAALSASKNEDLQERIDDLERRLRRLAVTVSDYRSTAVLLGESHPRTLEAWQRMKRAGDEARRAVHLTVDGGGR